MVLKEKSHDPHCYYNSSFGGGTYIFVFENHGMQHHGLKIHMSMQTFVSIIKSILQFPLSFIIIQYVFHCMSAICPTVAKKSPFVTVLDLWSNLIPVVLLLK